MVVSAHLPDGGIPCSKAKTCGLADCLANVSPCGAVDAFDDPPSKSLGRICSEFADAFFKKLTGAVSTPRICIVNGAQPIGASGLFDELLACKPRAGKRCVCYLSLAQIGHDMVLETAVDDASGKLRARPFSAWVQNYDSSVGFATLIRDERRVQNKSGVHGYLASEWAASTRCK